MKFTYLELNGFKRFKLNEINSFSMEMHSPLQIILGSNGAGKTSALQQLTPLPPNKEDFTKTGSKIIHIEHHHSKYVLQTTFSPSQKHSFIKDSIEYNEGGTITVQKELVKEHFGITNDIQALIIGEEQFSSMSASRRKEWFITLCETNYDYAIKVYNKLKERHRDTIGALKLAKKRIVTESEKQLKSEEEAKLINEVKDLHDQLNFLLEYRKPVEADPDMLSIEQSNLDSQLTKLLNRLNLLKQQLIHNRHLTDEQVSLFISNLNNQLIKQQTLLQSVSEEYSSNEKKINILQKAEQQTVDSLQRDINQLIGESNKLKDNLLFNHVNYDAQTATNALSSIKETLVDIFINIPANQSRKYSSDNLTKAREELATYTVKRQKSAERLLELQTKQKHMLAHKDKPDVDCPQCKHKFSLHYNEDQMVLLEREIESIIKQREEVILPKLKTLEEYIESCLNYSRLYRQYNQLQQNISILSPYFDYLNEKNIITHSPSSGINELNLIEKDLRLQVQLNQIQSSISEKLVLLNSLKDVGTSDLKVLLERNKYLEINIGKHTTNVSRLNKRLLDFNTLLNQIKEIKSTIVKLEEIILRKETLHKEEVETLRRSILNDAIRQMQSILANKENILTQSKMLHSVISNINLQISELEVEEKALASIVKILSPTEGLIAEGLYGFINAFITEMNNFIKRVWNYPLEILSCALEEDSSIDLNYKFPIRIYSQENPVPDVSKGSKGMLEIINLAYKVVAMRYLGLHDGALILDEFSSSLDTGHKAEAVILIKSLLEQQVFNQIYLVSHDLNQYSGLSHADICVLNDLNIIVPNSDNPVNYHVKMS